MCLFLMAAVWGLFGCKELLPVPQSGNNSSGVKSALSAPENLTATHGKKQKIRLDWTSIPSARRYYIYSADTPFDEYKQINETTNDSPFIEISVPAGYSGYFKVAAVNALGEVSDKSLSAYGTSLAMPKITAIQEEEEHSATVYWFMENLNRKTYLNDVYFHITCYDEKNTAVAEKNISHTLDTYCTFDGLASGRKYLYEVETWVGAEQTSVEKSLKVDSETAVSLIPQIPQFTVSEGTSADSIKISITLPPMVKIQMESAGGGSNQASYEDRPLFFKIEKLQSNGEYLTVVPYLAFDGSTTPKQKDDASFANYAEGTVITWTDTSVERGVKYTYRVLSYTDNYFDKGGSRISVTHDSAKANTGIGWAAAAPRIVSSPVSYNMEAVPTEPVPEEADQTYKKSAAIEISTSWNSFGKDSDYAYLLLETRTPLKENGVTGPQTRSFVTNKNGSCYFDSLAEIESVSRTFDFAEYNDENKDEFNKAVSGYYEYSFYIVPKSAKQTDETNIDAVLANSLTSVKDASRKLVTSSEDLTVPKIAVEDGYKDKVKITWNSDPNVTAYKLVRYTLDTNGDIDSSIDAVEVKNVNSPYEDKVESGRAYSYTLYASNSTVDDVPSDTLKAYTLGTPVVTFDKSEVDYDTLTVKWNTVLHNDEFNSQDGVSRHNVKYTVAYNGNTYEFLQSEVMPKAESDDSGKYEDKNDNYELTCVNGKEFILKIKNGIAGFTYADGKKSIHAKDAGADSDLFVYASNDKTATDSDMTVGSVKVRTLGPANIGLTTTKAANDKRIDIAWNKIDGAAGYVIRRVCPRTRLGEDEDKTDFIFVSADGNVTNNGDKVGARTVVESNVGNTFSIHDNYCAASDETSAYQMNQATIDFGLEFVYTVFPVKKADDNPFESSRISYTNDSEVSVTGYTHGYGMNVVASKADYAEEIEITWEKPNGANKRPYAYWRKEGDTKWQMFGQLNPSDEKVTYIPDKSDRCARFEFLVTYNQGGANFEPTFVDYQKTKLDTVEEQNNIGYQFTLPEINLATDTMSASNETFTESVSWVLWDRSMRRHQPGDGMDGDCYELQVKNLNCSADWFTIATISKDGKVKENPKDWYDVSYKTTANEHDGSMEVTALNNGAPFAVSSRLTRASGQASAITGCHDGLLKVQRDYKHYYRLVAKRVNKDGDEVVAALGDFDNTERNDKGAKNEVYAYRKISDDEFIKGALLIVADATYQAGIRSGTISSDETNTVYGEVGSYFVRHHWGSRNFSYGTNDENFQHKFMSVPGSLNVFTSDWTLKIPNVTAGKSVQGNSLTHFTWNSITAVHELELPSYQGKIWFRAGANDCIGTFGSITQKHNLCIQYTRKTDTDKDEDKIIITTAHPGDTTYNTSYDTDSTAKYTADGNLEMFLEWFPYRLGESRDSAVNSYDENVPVYSGLWWKVRSNE